MDSTYRLIVEGHGVLTFGVMDPAQRYHIVAHAVVSKEDAEGQLHCIKQLRKGVSSTIEEYARRGFSA